MPVDKGRSPLLPAKTRSGVVGGTRRGLRLGLDDRWMLDAIEASGNDGEIVEHKVAANASSS